MAVVLVGLSIQLPRGAFAAEGPSAVTTGKMELTFDQGFLTHWKNKETGETVEFGTEDFQPTKDDLPYKPGPWFVSYDLPPDLAHSGATWQDQVRTLDDTAVELVQSVSRQGGKAPAVQWSVRLPLNAIDAFHFPRGLSPARIVSKDSPSTGLVDFKSNYFQGRPAQLSFHEWRHRYYVIQGRTGGLLIYVDDPDFQHRPALEHRLKDGVFLVCNRSIQDPPWSDKYTGCRWVIRQYTGPVTVAAQIYQDYLAKTYGLTPLDQRPTAWAGKLAYCFVKAPWASPQHFAKHESVLNYSDHWDQSLAESEKWLKDLAQVMDPSRVLFYFTGWNYTGLDVSYPEHSVNPFLAYTVGKARRLGFHVMLHFNCHMMFNRGAGSDAYLTYFKNQWKALGQPDNFGVGVDALTKDIRISLKKPSSHQRMQGLDFEMTRYHMAPSYELWRRIWVAQILSAVRAIGADAVHIDVPSIWIEQHNERYGMNLAQGLREQFRLLRATLDENGLQQVAIATELTPSEPILKYVDLAQNSRDHSAFGALSGKKEELIELQVGADLQAVEQRRAATKDSASKKSTEKLSTAEKKKAAKAKGETFDIAATRAALSSQRDLGEPAIDSLVIGPYVMGYPHLGALAPDTVDAKTSPADRTRDTVVQALAAWYAFTHNTMPHTLGGYDWHALSNVSRGKVAMGLFWQKHSPRPAPLATWKPGEIARYRLDDGRFLVINRPDPLVMHFQIEGAETLADLHLFEGWTHADALLKHLPATLQ